jgi:DNA polymerase-3 subunit alpha
VVRNLSTSQPFLLNQGREEAEGMKIGWQVSAEDGISGGLMRVKNKKQFIHLHVHSEHSPKDGTVPIKDLVAKAARLGMPAIALSDHGVITGVEDLFKECVEKRIKAIPGCEVYMEPLIRPSRYSRYHLVLLTENKMGYENLKTLVSRDLSESEKEKSAISREILRCHSDGIIALSACKRGELANLVLAERYSEAMELACSYRDIFGNNSYFIELIASGSEPYPELNSRLMDLAEEGNFRLVATGDVHYLEKGEFMIPPGSTEFPKNRKRPELYKLPLDEFYLKSTEEICKLFGFSASHAVRNAVSIAERCNYGSIEC